ncbi:MAG: RsmB/NOP family class I SAM-dependent RNA methyltransferase [Aestuariivirgaceae bacterium]
MRPGGRASAAIEVLDQIMARHRPAAEVLKDWGKSHRFAGTSDRAAIGNLVYDALRQRASLGHAMGSAAPRALVLAVLRWRWGISVDVIADLCTEPHGPEALTDEERARLASPRNGEAPPWVKGDYPEWLDSSFARVFAEARSEQGAALAFRAPVDIRVNTLKVSPEKVLKLFEKFHAVKGRFAPAGIRLPPPAAAGRNPNVEAEPAHGRGWFEVQDEGSQIAALLTGARPGEQCADICTGAGGKTLAIAALMENRGQIHAYDADRHRLRPIFERMQRAGARNIQVIPSDAPQRLEELEGKMDMVLIDAPCSGSGAWRRKPDSKWRLKPDALHTRLADQRRLLAQGAGLVRPGGRMVYVTCSLLPEENADQVEAFLRRHRAFASVPYGDVWRKIFPSAPPASADASSPALLLTPLDHATDGFFISTMVRNS